MIPSSKSGGKTQDSRDHSRWVQRSLSGTLSLIAILLATRLEHVQLFTTISFVVSDYISRLVGTGTATHVVLVRIDRTLSKSEWTNFLSKAVPSLVTQYRATAVGIDIDFSGQNYEKLAQTASDWEADPLLAQKIVWAVGYEPGLGNREIVELNNKAEECINCADGSCQTRYIPKPVFGTSRNPTNYALAIATPDVDAINRASVHFVCHGTTQSPVPTFHFKLVEQYCREHPNVLASCTELKPNEQAKTWIHTWYGVAVFNLCDLVLCPGESGKVINPVSDKLAGKLVILYSDLAGNDEHNTIVGVEKGAKIIASLVENELQFGVLPRWPSAVLKYSLEGAITLLLFAVFHSRRTQRYAILIAAAVFVGYLYLIPHLAQWLPDFRHYVLAIIVAFTIELFVKSAWHSLLPAHSGERRVAVD